MTLRTHFHIRHQPPLDAWLKVYWPTLVNRRRDFLKPCGWTFIGDVPFQEGPEGIGTYEVHLTRVRRMHGFSWQFWGVIGGHDRLVPIGGQVHYLTPLPTVGDLNVMPHRQAVPRFA